MSDEVKAMSPDEFYKSMHDLIDRHEADAEKRHDGYIDPLICIRVHVEENDEGDLQPTHFDMSSNIPEGAQAVQIIQQIVYQLAVMTADRNRAEDGDFVGIDYINPGMMKKQ